MRVRARVVGRALLALVAVCAVGLWLAPSSAAQVSGEGFILSKRADFATQDRTFTRNETIYMRVWSNRIDGTRMRKNLWRLDNQGSEVKKSLTRNADGTFRASFRLADLPTSATTWGWKALLEDRQGRVYSPTASITVLNAIVVPPVADFVASPTTGTAPLSVAFVDRSTGAPTSWSWDFGDGTSSTLQNPSHSYTSPGNYSVRLTVTNSAGTNSVLRSALVSVAPPQPVADLAAGPTSGTAPLSVAFVDRSTGWPASWAWSFGDGTSSTLQNPSHVYATPGRYSISLTVTNATGSSSASRTDLVSVVPPPPVAALSASPTSGLVPLLVGFADLSTNTPSAWQWDFGDGASSTLQNPSHVYTVPGSYSVTLMVANEGGSSSALRTDLVSVEPPAPSADFSANPTSGLAPLSVDFGDLSSGWPASWSWDFGDGTTSALQDPSHVYVNPGSYSVSLTVTNATGSASTLRTDLVSADLPEPSADFAASPTRGTAPVSVAFTDLSSGWPSSWAWDFGDGTSSALQNPTHEYARPGSYSVSLTAANAAGSSSAVRNELVRVDPPPPVADLSASPTSGLVPLTVDFVDLSTGSPASWSWDFGDGTSSTLQNPAHEFALPGSYSVTLTVANEGGSSSALRSDMVSVEPPPPIADLSASTTDGPAPLSVDFLDLSSGWPAAWSWDFGDGTSSTLQNPRHVYATPGSYAVSLTVTNAAGSSGALLAEPVNAELPPPTAAFSASPASGIVPLLVEFTDRSSGWPTAWWWDFGDGTSSTLQNPIHEYTSPGSYAVTLTVANDAGADSLTLPDSVSAEVFAIEYGMNSSENVWYQRGIAFADAMARASEFLVVDGSITSTACAVIPFGRTPPLLGEGWPDFFALPAGTKAGARLFGSMKGSLPDGRVVPYVLTWEGTGSCRLSSPAVVSERNRTANRVEVFVDPTGPNANGLIWILDSSSRTDPVRNAHVWLPGMETEKPLLWPPFVEKLRAMNGGRGPRTWRAMDWCQVRQYGRTDGVAPFTFNLAGRITTRSPSQGTRRGVCPEYQVALCNAVGANLHFNLPHPANNISEADYATFVRDALTAIRDGSPAVPGINGSRPFAGLDPGLMLTLEFSNEMWNGGFMVNAWLRARAQAGGRTIHQQIALEIQRVFAIADDVFSGVHAPRLRKYVAGKFSDISFLQRILEALPRDTRVDAVGPACYFGPRQADIDAWNLGATTSSCPNCPTPERVVESARLTIPGLRVKLREHRLLADSFVNPDGSTPALELYEAGSSFVANYHPWGTAASQAQSIPGMYDAYVLDLIPLLVEEGVDLVNWYSFIHDNSAAGSGAGPFGHWESMNQTITLPVREPYLHEGAPKAAAVYKLPPSRH